MNETTELLDLSTLPADPEQARRPQEKSDVLGSTLDTIEVGSLAVDAAVLAVQVGGFAVEAGAATLKTVAVGAEVVGSLFAGLADL